MHRWAGRVLIVQDNGSLVGVWELASVDRTCGFYNALRGRTRCSQ